MRWTFLNFFLKIVMECVCTPMFSLMINGELKVFFFCFKAGLEARRSIILLFVVCMEYVAWILGQMSAKDPFHYHPRCIHMKLTYLSFADDLILSLKGDYASVYLMIRTFKLIFSLFWIEN